MRLECGAASAQTRGVQISFKACSHNISGLRSPAFARSMIFVALACLTPSSLSPIRRAMQTSSKATPRMRLIRVPAAVKIWGDRHVALHDCRRERYRSQSRTLGQATVGDEHHKRFLMCSDRSSGKRKKAPRMRRG